MNDQHIGAHRGHKRSLDQLELELQAIMSFPVGAGN